MSYNLSHLKQESSTLYVNTLLNLLKEIEEPFNYSNSPLHSLRFFFMQHEMFRAKYNKESYISDKSNYTFENISTPFGYANIPVKYNKSYNSQKYNNFLGDFKFNYGSGIFQAEAKHFTYLNLLFLSAHDIQLNNPVSSDSSIYFSLKNFNTSLFAPTTQSLYEQSDSFLSQSEVKRKNSFDKNILFKHKHIAYKAIQEIINYKDAFLYSNLVSLPLLYSLGYNIFSDKNCPLSEEEKIKLLHMNYIGHSCFNNNKHVYPALGTISSICLNFANDRESLFEHFHQLFNNPSFQKLYLSDLDKIENLPEHQKHNSYISILSAKYFSENTIELFSNYLQSHNNILNPTLSDPLVYKISGQIPLILNYLHDFDLFQNPKTLSRILINKCSHLQNYILNNQEISQPLIKAVRASDPNELTKFILQALKPLSYDGDIFNPDKHDAVKGILSQNDYQFKIFSIIKNIAPEIREYELKVLLNQMDSNNNTNHVNVKKAKI